MVKVSIIVPIYNVENYVEKCLKSLVGQSLKDIEIICIDDGSIDNSLKIVNLYAKSDERIKVLTQTNQGQSVARNNGIKIARGEFIGFVDADDWVDDEYFEKLYNAAVRFNCDIACAGFRKSKFSKGRIRKKFTKYNVLKNIEDKVKADNLPQDNYIWNKIYSREKFLKNNFTFPAGRYFEDVAILIKILYFLGDMVTVPDTYYHYRKRGGSTVRTQSIKHSTDFKWARKELYSFAKEHNINIAIRKDYDRKISYNILGLPILKSYCCENKTIYKLLGFIPFASRIIK